MTKKVVGIYLVILVFFPPQILYYFESAKLLTSATAAARYFVTFFSILYIIIKKLHKEVARDSFIVLNGISVALMVGALVFNGSFYLTAALSCVTYLGFVLVNILLLYNYKNVVLKAYKEIFFIYILIHFITIYFFPEGMVSGFTGDGRIYFLGSKNAITTYLLAAILMQYLLCKLESHVCRCVNDLWLTAVLFTGISIANKSSTAIVAILIIDVYLGISFWGLRDRKIDKILKKIYFEGLLLVLIIFFVGVILMGGGNNFFINKLTSLLGRDMTFSGRKAIWAMAVDFLKENPVWGMGLNVQYDAWGNGKYVYSAHNTFLDYGVKYGCLSLLFWMASLLLVMRIALRNLKKQDVQFSFTVLIALLFSSMLEALEGSYNFWLIVLVSYLISKKEDIFGDRKMQLDFYERIRKKYFEIREKWIGEKRFNYIKKQPLKNGIYHGNERKEKIIISMASYNARYNVLPMTLKSILLQSVKPDKIIVWLDEQIQENALPDKLKIFCEYGVEFRFTHDGIKPHKKYLYAIKEFPEAIIITVDDDVIYSADMIESLMSYHERYPNMVCARRVHMITFGKDGIINPYDQWKFEYRDAKEPSHLLCATGCGGTLYPPHVLPEEAFDIDLIKNMCLEADDIWLKVMELKKDIKVVWVKNKYVMPLETKESQYYALNTSNVLNRKNDAYMMQLLRAYPEALKNLKKNCE